jgi:microcystin-dependent protein
MTAALPMGGQKITGMADPTISTDGATKNYVDTTTGAFFSTGDVKLTLKNTPDSGWLMFNDNTFGSATSGAGVASNATQALFTLFFNNLSDTAAALFTSGGGATTRAAQVSAAAAWAANCRMLLPYTMGRALGVAGAASGLTARALGSVVGEETHLLALSEIPNHNHNFSDPGHSHAVAVWNTPGPNNIFGSSAASSQGTATINPAFTGITFNAQGGGGAHNNIQPTVFMNAMVKL